MSYRKKSRRQGKSRLSPQIAAGLVLLGLLAAPLVARETIQIITSSTQPRAGDATINQGSPNTNIAGAQTLTVESLQGNKNQRALLQFDLSSLPNVAIKAASLTLSVTSTNATAAKSRTYGAFPLTSLFRESDVTWDTRVADLPWATAGGGGDFGNTATGTFKVTGTGTVSVNITSDLQNWYNATPAYGELIKDQTEGAAGTGFTTTFAAEEASSATAPSLSVTFVQNVQSLTATPGNATVTLNWAIPSLIGTPTTAGEHYTGTLILRRANLPVDKGSVPTDTKDPGLCATVGSGKVVFDDTSGATSFTDNSSDTCGAPANGTMYFYKVFLRDNLNFYSAQPIANGSTFTEEISAMPNTSAATVESSSWINATASTDLAAPALYPGTAVMVGAGTNLLFGIDPNTGLRKYLPVSLGGAISSRSPLIDAGDSTLGKNVIYVGDSDSLVYAVATDTGQILWAVNPTGFTTNNFTGAASVELKEFNSALTDDIVILGTDDGATTSGNQIVGVDGNTGANAWTPIVGNANGVSPMDIITSTPTVDYVNNAVWVASHSNCGTSQPSLWKLKTAAPGGVLLTQNLGDMDVSPALTFSSDVLFAASGGYALNGQNQCVAGNSTLFAINPSSGATLASFAPNPADGAIVGFPLVLGFSSPYTIVFSGAANVHVVQYDKAKNQFTAQFTLPIRSPAAPIGYSGFQKVYVGSGDGFIHEIDLVSKTDDFDMYVNTVNTGGPVVIGNVSLDLSLSRVYIATTDQRSYAYPFPF
jgi:hypothetical protein